MSDQTTDQTTPDEPQAVDEQQTTPEVIEEDTDPQESAQPVEDTEDTEDQDTEQDTGKTPKLVAEAKKYRQRAQQAETERDQARDQLTALQTQIVAEHAAVSHGINAELFGASGTDVATLFTEEGQLDHTALATTCDDIRERFGIRGRTTTTRCNPLQGNSASYPGDSSWSEALTGTTAPTPEPTGLVARKPSRADETLKRLMMG